jgi:phosphoribosylformylglycinamidine synthase
MWQFAEAIRGLADACQQLGTPVTGGNVSLYNENPRGAVFPTPVIGMVGLIDSVAHITRSNFQETHDTVVLLGEPTAHIGASEYLARIHGVTAGSPPPCDLDAEKALIEALLEAIRGGVVTSAHDCAEGGLAVALAECCIMDRNAERGAKIDLSPWKDLPTRALLFGEAQARVVISTSMPDTLVSIARKHGVPARTIGQVGELGAPLHISTGTATLDIALERLDDAYHEAIPKIMSQSVVS